MPVFVTRIYLYRDRIDKNDIRKGCVVEPTSFILKNVLLQYEFRL